MKITAIICTYNPRMDYLQRALDALKTQTLSQKNWELLVIDNASTEPLKARLDLSWHTNAKCIRETKLGTAYARIRGISESVGEIIVFIDDDNVLDREYFANSLRIASEWPQLGIWGGSQKPEFEIEPPAAILPYLAMLALREVSKPLWSNVNTCAEAEPWGAGICVRREAAIAHCENFRNEKFVIAGNTGNLILGGDDTEMCYSVCKLNLGMGVFPCLTLVHLIAQRRLNEEYIARLDHGYAIRHSLLSYKWRGQISASPYSLVEVLRCLKQLMTINSFERRLAWGRYRAKIFAKNIIAKANASNRSADRVN